MLDKIRGKDDRAMQGHGAADPAHPQGGATVEDPVCHMQVNPQTAAGQSQHGNHTYFFCSAGCKTRFDQDPHRFLGAHGH